MNKNYNSPLGEIVIIKNIIFKDNLDVDHSWNNGRPCLIIYSDEEYDYYLTITSLKPKKEYFYLTEKEYYNLRNKDFLYMIEDKKHGRLSGLANLKYIYRKKISGYQTIGRLKEESYLNILKKFSEYQKKDIEEVTKEERRR